MNPIEILSKMEKLFPDAQTELTNWSSPFQFLVCIVLSAQTTDKQVNSLTKKLFKKYPTPELMSKADISDVEKHIKGVNYYKNKAKFLINLSQILVEQYKSEVPKEQSELIKLPGVGKKTANVFLNDLYHANQGIAVDTHVMRVAQRLGLTKETDPDKISRDLEKLYPKEIWYKVNSTFVLYGRYVCKARMTKSDCIFKDICDYCKNLSPR